MAATWNPQLLVKAGEITAYETRAAGVPWTFSPVLDLGVDPRWPRQWETFGEDPYLVSEMGKHLIKGLQGSENEISSPIHISACLKHYLGYSQTLSGKDRTPAWIPENKLREYHLPSFKAAVEAGAMTVMVNSGEINGLPVHANPALLTDLLKNELQFNGFVVSDWSDIEYLHTRHKIASTQKEAVKIAVNAGIDMSMVPYNFHFAGYLIELVNEGEVPMSRIDDAVTRILRVKYLMGLFDRPTTNRSDYPLFGSDEFAEASLKTAEESITLLKNTNQFLPLAKNTKILVGGPAANTLRPLNGGWSYSWQGNLVDEFASEFETFFEAIQSKASVANNVTLEEGVRYDEKADYKAELKDDFSAFSKKAENADVIVLCIGENSYTEKPGDLEDLYISDYQQELVATAYKTGKPVVLVLAEGRPRVISKIEPMAKAIIQTYLPGNFGGKALASILFGDVNPSGKLPYTYPRFPNSLEPYYIKHAEQLEIAGSPTGTQYNPQYHFGHGLSYSTFEYLSLETDKSSYKTSETIKLTVELRNNSSFDGKETLQIYSSDHFASLTPSVKRLRAFKKIMLKAEEKQTVTFEIPVRHLAFVALNNKWIVEKGDFTLSIAGLTAKISIENEAYFN
jgi:beta-glucosidase